MNMKPFFYFFASIVLCVGCNRSASVDATGTFEATEITVSSEAVGRILSFSADEGSELKEGECVGIIDTVQLYLFKLQLQKNVLSVRSNRPDVRKQIAALKAEIAKQEKERVRTENLLKDGATTSKQLDDILSTISVLRNRLEAQKSSLENDITSLDEKSSSLDIQIAQVEDKLLKCRIVSPISGVVLAKYAEAGEFVSIGHPLFKIADLKQMFLRAYFTSKQLSEIKLGEKVKVSADFGGESQRTYEGTIVWIASESEFTPKTIQTDDSRANMVYATKIAVKNDGYIKIGMYGKVSLQKDENGSSK